MKTCSACEVPYTLTASGVCKCGGFTNKDGDCIVCSNSKDYFDGNECKACGSNCDTCKTPTGDCTAC